MRFIRENEHINNSQGCNSSDIKTKTNSIMYKHLFNKAIDYIAVYRTCCLVYEFDH